MSARLRVGERALPWDLWGDNKGLVISVLARGLEFNLIEGDVKPKKTNFLSVILNLLINMQLQIIFQSNHKKVGLTAQYISLLSKLPLGSISCINSSKKFLQWMSVSPSSPSFPVTGRHYFIWICPLFQSVLRKEFYFITGCYLD